jgi:hypothetical protein
MNVTSRKIAGFTIAVETRTSTSTRTDDQLKVSDMSVRKLKFTVLLYFFQTQILIVQLPGDDFPVTTVQETLLSRAFSLVNIEKKDMGNYRLP